MISTHDAKTIYTLTLKFWTEHAKSREFRELAKGKEIGHRIADYVDDTTTRMLAESLTIGHQLKGGNKLARSMGDFWIKSEGIWNPVNIKAGEMGKNGQPNIVSLQKLLDCILKQQINAYYLLVIKFDMRNIDPLPNVFFFDILDYLDYVTYDSGPGQMMLKEQELYGALNAQVDIPDIPLPEKVEHLILLLRDGYNRLLRNREKRMSQTETKYAKFTTSIHTINHVGLEIG